MNDEQVKEIAGKLDAIAKLLERLVVELVPNRCDRCNRARGEHEAWCPHSPRLGDRF